MKVWLFRILGTLALIACDPPSEQEQTGASAPPRWVLRDKDGTQLRVLAEPKCGKYGTSEAQGRCLHPEFGSTGAFPCARIVFYEDRYINLQYDLQSGKIGPCMGSMEAEIYLNQSWRDGQAEFTNDQCTGDPYISIHGALGQAPPIHSDTRELYVAEGSALWYVSDQDCPGVVDRWSWSLISMTCVKGEPAYLCPFRKLPNWVLDLLPNPPYTLTMEYD